MKRRLSRRTFAIGSVSALLSATAISWALAAPTEKASQGPAPAATPRPIAHGEFLTIVVPENAKASVAYAADELGTHMAKALGSPTRVATEDTLSANDRKLPCIYLGETVFARSHGVNWDVLEPEASILRSIGKDLCIVGLDGTGEPLDSDVWAGTLFGVYAFLEKVLKVRWLWPGDLGTVVPKIGSFSVPPLDEVVRPRLMQRHVRLFKQSSPGHPQLGFSAAAAAEYLQAERVFLRRHRMGRRRPMSYGHAFRKWWGEYGGKHPQWFQLVDGQRGPLKKGGDFSMSIADPGLHEKIVSLWRKAGGAKPGPSFINAVENDTPGLCECALCRALDSAPPADYLKFAPPGSTMARTPFVTDRYARSWLAIQQLAARDNPDVTVVGYAYFNYFVPPASGVKLNKNILIGFCPSSWFYPRTHDVQAWMKRQWRGWADTGAQIFMRTNYFLDGYCMPYIFAHQFADDFRNAADHAMVGTDFDSLTGHWATQGPTLYLLMRLQACPDADPDEVLDEYYSGFGPAAADVRAYFAFWERFTMDLSGSLDATFERLKASRWKSWAKAAGAVYPQDSFKAGRKLLEKAAGSAAPDAEATARIRFLELGLEHARLSSQAASQLSLGAPPSRPLQARAALDALVAFRRRHERSGISNFDHCAWVEGNSWRLS